MRGVTTGSMRMNTSTTGQRAPRAASVRTRPTSGLGSRTSAASRRIPGGRLLYRLLRSTPADEHATDAQARAAARYFAALVDDYRQAYRGRGRGVVQRAVNRLFR